MVSSWHSSGCLYCPRMDLTDPKTALEYYQRQLDEVERDYVVLSRKREGLVSIIQGLQRMTSLEGHDEHILNSALVSKKQSEAVSLALLALRQSRAPLSIAEVIEWLEARGRKVHPVELDRAMRREAVRREGRVRLHANGRYAARTGTDTSEASEEVTTAG